MTGEDDAMVDPPKPSTPSRLKSRLDQKLNYHMQLLKARPWAFSKQFEIGLISEASIGQIQRYRCAYGFVDHIVTPNGGLFWMVVGDALDRYASVPLENRTHNTALRILARVVPIPLAP